MVYADADGSMVLLADIKEGYKAVVYLLQLLGILFIGILQMFESTCCIHIVSRIDADFFSIYPSWRRPMLIFIRFSASLIPWAVRRTYSPPASTIRLVCATLASVSCVAVFVILCMRIGLEPPIGVAPMFTSDVSRRE